MGRCRIDFKELEGTKKNKRYVKDHKVNWFFWRVWLSAYHVTRLCADVRYQKRRHRLCQSLQRRQAPMATVSVLLRNNRATSMRLCWWETWAGSLRKKDNYPGQEQQIQRLQCVKYVLFETYKELGIMTSQNLRDIQWQEGGRVTRSQNRSIKHWVWSTSWRPVVFHTAFFRFT